MTLEEKKEKLQRALAGYGSVAVAYSGGVDSTFLAAFANHTLAPGNVLLINARSPSFPKEEAEFVDRFAAAEGIRLRCVDTHELEMAEYADNPPSRCYFCKTEMYSVMQPIVAAEGMAVLADGANVDDRADVRPGMRAAEEHGVVHPLMAAEMGKSDIRALSREMDLETWDKPAYACLASRFPYGERITAEKLARVEASEAVLRRAGFRVFRVRSHGDVARIEFGAEEIKRGFEARAEIDAALRALNYAYVTIDLQGYRSGSMNEVV